MDVYDLIGADDFTPVPVSQALARPLSRVEQKAFVADVINRGQRRRLSIALLILGGGIVVSGGVGALLWVAHRGLGFLLGSLLVGPLIGGVGAGAYLANAGGLPRGEF